MNWIELNREDAERLFNQYCESGDYTYQSDYKAIRDDLCMLYEHALSKVEKIDDQASWRYHLDLYFGLSLYEVLNEKYNMNVRTASNEGVWRYLSVCVVPDLVEKRYGKDHPDRFWKKPKRLWLRVLWWYIYLSWQGTNEETMNILMNNSTDEILQLVDRCGRGGYRVDLYRELMKKNAELDVSERKSKQTFRKMMVLNTARVQVLEPELTPGGNRGYVNSLSDYFTKG